MQAIDAALMRRRYRKRPIRVDGLSDLEVDMNQMRSLKVSVKANQPLPWETRSYGQFVPGKSFRDLALMAVADETTLNTEKAKIEAGPNYEGRDADISRINGAIRQLSKSYDFRTEQARISATYFKQKQLLATVATAMKQPGQDVPKLGELLKRGTNVEQIVRHLTETIGATRAQIEQQVTIASQRRDEQKANRDGINKLRSPIKVGSRYPDTRHGPRSQSLFDARRAMFSPSKVQQKDEGSSSDLTKAKPEDDVVQYDA